jgi:hypothetical protein
LKLISKKYSLRIKKKLFSVKALSLKSHSVKLIMVIKFCIPFQKTTKRARSFQTPENMPYAQEMNASSTLILLEIMSIKRKPLIFGLGSMESIIS